MNLVIIQARLGSTRLPGKVLKQINNKTLLELLVQRISKSKLLDEIIIATTIEKIDDPLVEFCNKLKLKYFRGSENDVLDRFYQTINSTFHIPHSTFHIIRVTADCPLHHGEVIDFAITEFEKRKADYFSNSNQPPVLEDGCDTEIFSFNALETAWREAKKNSEREHVTPFIKNSGKFKCEFQKFNSEYNFKLSVDNENDFKTVSEIFNYFRPDEFFTINQIVELLKKKPELLEYNKNSVINAGYQKSLANDKYTK